jgi:hypothetical protein
MTKKELIEALSKFEDDARITVSVLDNEGSQCYVDIVNIRELIIPEVAAIIPQNPNDIEYVDF